MVVLPRIAGAVSYESHEHFKQPPGQHTAAAGRRQSTFLRGEPHGDGRCQSDACVKTNSARVRKHITRRFFVSSARVRLTVVLALDLVVIRVRLICRTIVLVTTLVLTVAAEGFAQNSEEDPALRALLDQLEEVRSQLATLQNRIATLEAAKRTPETASSSESILLAGEAPAAEAVRSQRDATSSAGGPAAFHFKGLTLTPGGFLQSTALVRSRNENADVATSYSAVPLNGSSNANLSELRGTVRTSQLSLLIQGAAGNTKLRGYVETDFLGTAPSANYVQSSSWIPRLRQVWTQLERPSGLTITAGQMWSLLTTNRHGIANREELRPNGEDGNYDVGFTWTRERAVRVTQNFNDRVWIGFALENPESTYSAAFVPPNVMGLNTSPNAATGVNLLPFLANYSTGQSTNLAPDLVAKMAYEPGWGHFEIKGLGRLFRDRIAATATTSGRTNVTKGYGVGFGALMPFANKRLEISLEGLAGDGIGRYGAAGFPDVTLDPTTGEMRPLRQARIMGGLVYHHGSRLDLYAYGGDEYTDRRAFLSPTGTAAGYGSPLVSYASCTNEVALNACRGDNRNIYEGTIGYWYRLYRGEAGQVLYGNQVVYVHRDLWSGLGRTPDGSIIVVYSTLRFYLP